MINNGMARTVIAACQQLFGQRHAHGIGQALAQRAGCRLYTRRDAHFGMAGRDRVKLAKLPDLLQRQIVAAQMQQGIQQHGAMAVGQHKAVAIEPSRIGRVMGQMLSPQHLGNIGHAHGRAWMARLRLLDGVGRQKAQRICMSCILKAYFFG